MNDKKLQDAIARFEQELRELKTAQRLSGAVKSFYASFTPTSGIDPITITYANGSQAIITDVYSSGTVILCKPSGNTQKMLFNGQDSVPIIIASTRPIQNISQ